MAEKTPGGSAGGCADLAVQSTVVCQLQGNVVTARCQRITLTADDGDWTDVGSPVR